jgi:hypothetical protein
MRRCACMLARYVGFPFFHKRWVRPREWTHAFPNPISNGHGTSYLSRARSGCESVVLSLFLSFSPSLLQIVQAKSHRYLTKSPFAPLAVLPVVITAVVSLVTWPQ